MKGNAGFVYTPLNKSKKTGGISMADFGIRFFLCNILICVTIARFLMIKQILRNHLTNRMQFNLWFLLPGLLTIPFIPIRPAPSSQIFSLLDKWKNAVSPNTETITETEDATPSPAITRPFLSKISPLFACVAETLTLSVEDSPE